MKTPTKIPNVVAIASGKGGVGKTWFTISLSHYLSLQGYRPLLFDADLGLANVHIQLGHTPKADLGSVITGQTKLRSAASRVPETGFDVIAGRSGSGTLANLPTNRLMHLRHELMELAQDYSLVLMDLGAGVERTARMLSSQAGTNLILCTDEPTSLTDAYAYIKLTHMNDPKADIRIVVNMADSHHNGEETFTTLQNACQSFLKIKLHLAGVIRRDRHVKDSIRTQTPIFSKFPNCDAAVDIQAIASHLIEGDS